jgi:hypothetical protein
MVANSPIRTTFFSGGLEITNHTRREMILITQLLGGLGNQMFQYALGRRLAHDYGLKLKLDTSLLLDHSKGTHDINRHFEIGNFSLAASIATPGQRWRYNAHGLPALVRLARRLLLPLSKRRMYHETDYKYDSAICNCPTPPRYISGLWQSWKYIDPISDQLRCDFTLPEPTCVAYEKVKDSLNSPGAVCLQVRRGDYITSRFASHTIGFVGIDYYRRSVHHATTKLATELNFFIFTDDVPWCRSELSWIGDNVHFVEEILPNLKSAEYLKLMSAGRNFIIGNSTFAWWAAWLSRGPDKMVIAPAQWFRDTSLDASDLCPNDWVRL